MKSLAMRQAELETRKAALWGRMGGIKDELAAHRETDWDDLATEREGDEVLERLGIDAQTELRAISAALGRVADGSYGTCVRCGKKIGEARLGLLPYTPFCKDDAA